MSRNFTIANFEDGKAPDIRKELAVRFYNKYVNGVHMVHKAPRAGATIAFISAAVDRKEPILVLEPNGYIATQTVSDEAKLYCNGDAEIVRVPGNHECLRIEKMIAEYPLLEHLPVIPLPEKCDECELYTECPMTEIVRKQDILDGATMTYYKLAALMLAPQGKKDAETVPMPKQILDIISRFPIILLDEAHVLQEGAEAKVITKRIGRDGFLDLTKYQCLEDRYPTLATVAAAFDVLITSKEYNDGVDVVKNMMSGDHVNRHIRHTIDNPNQIEAGYKFTMEFFNSLVEMIKDLQDKTHYEKAWYAEHYFSVGGLVQLFNMFNIVISKRISIGADLHHGMERDYVDISVTALDTNFYRMLKEFFKGIDTRKKRIIISSATLGQANYGALFNKYTHISQHMYGDKGDPWRANSKMLFIADSKKEPYYANSYRIQNRIDSEVGYVCSKALKALGEDGVMITALNRNEANWLQESLKYNYGWDVEVNYYRSDKSMGVVNGARLHIVVGAAFVPAHAYDPVSDTLEESRRIREEIIQAATYQAMTRVKDSAGLEPSAIMAIYCTPVDVEKITSWGIDRTMLPNEADTGPGHFHNDVFVGTPVNPPNIVASTNLLDMLNKALKHLKWGEKPANGENRIKRENNVCGITVPEKSQKPEHVPAYCENTFDNDLKEVSVLRSNLQDRSLYILCFKPPHGNFLEGKFDLSLATYEIIDISRKELLSRIGKLLPTAENNDNLYQDMFDNFREVETEPEIHDYETEFVVSEISQILARKQSDPRARGYRMAEDTYMVASLKEYRNRFEGQFPNLIIEPEQEYKSPIEILRRLIVNRYDHWFKQKDDGSYTVETHKNPELFQQKVDQALKSHLDGVNTFGMPAIDRFADGIWGCIDIDAHRKPTDTDEMAEIKAFHAKASVQLLLDYMRSKDIPYMFEQSGSSNSYHIWVFFQRTSSKKIQYFMRSLAICAGIDYKGMKIEINPKQTNLRRNKADSRSTGNQVKMPFALHRSKGTRSMVFNENATDPAQRWQGIDLRGRSNFEPMKLSRLDIGRLEPVSEEEVLVTIESEVKKMKANKPDIVTPDDEKWFLAKATDEGGRGKRAKFYNWCLDQDLSGPDGHYMRIYISRYYVNIGYPPEKVAELFAKQSDYNYEYSLKQVKGLASVVCGHIRYETLRDKCSDFVARFEKETGLLLQSNAGGV